MAVCRMTFEAQQGNRLLFLTLTLEQGVELPHNSRILREITLKAG